MEGQSGLGKPRRLRFKGDQPQQDTADEANGKEEGEPCQHYEHRGDLRPRRFFWTIPAIAHAILLPLRASFSRSSTSATNRSRKRLMFSGVIIAPHVLRP